MARRPQFKRETPEWQRQVDAVLKLRARGFAPEKIEILSQIPHDTVTKIIEEDNENGLIIKQNWEEKMPVMRDIISMGLNGIRETLKEMANPEVRREMIRTVGDVASLTRVVESLNLLLRLEEGKSTANVAKQHQHTYKETREVLQELSKVDPVFDYEPGKQ